MSRYVLLGALFLISTAIAVWSTLQGEQLKSSFMSGPTWTPVTGWVNELFFLVGSVSCISLAILVIQRLAKKRIFFYVVIGFFFVILISWIMPSSAVGTLPAGYNPDNGVQNITMMDYQGLWNYGALVCGSLLTVLFCALDSKVSGKKSVI